MVCFGVCRASSSLAEGCGLHFVLCKIVVVKRLCFETTSQHVVKLLLCMSSP